MPPERYAAPLSLVETQSDGQRKCPYCRWGSHSLYRLDSWPNEHAGCADCVLELLASEDYFIYHAPGPADPSDNDPTSIRTRTRASTEAQSPTGASSHSQQSADG
jgi:hypothetical protein